MANLTNLFNIDYRVYIAGVYLPSSSVTINSSFGGLPTCNVALPPYSQFFGMGRQDRVPLQVFVQNTFVGSEDYILIFDGEITDTGYYNSAVGREFVVNAQSFTVFFRDTTFRLMSSLEDYAQANVNGERFANGTLGLPLSFV